jgi:site-specific recombinase XerD
MPTELVPLNDTYLPANPGESPAVIYIASLAAGSRPTMEQALRSIAALLGRTILDCPWHMLRHHHTAAIRSQLAEKHAAATANKMLSALRGVLKAAWRLKLIDSDDYTRAVDITPVKATTLPRGRALEGGELRQLFRACAADEGPAGRRDAALLAVLYGAGLRRAEAARLDLTDFNPKTGELRIRGKGNKQRLAYAANGSMKALAAWLAVRGSAPGRLFLPVNKGGRIVGHAMTEQAVYNMLVKRAGEAGIDHVSPHDLRRSFVSDMIDAGADISAVQQLAGHANIATTQRYDRRGEQAKARAATLLHVPVNG